ncbi:NADPH-dependent FMN reductase [Paenisporosarcina cavernae]|uniref:NAD(P)H-dependent oxidoreductase n=1 Tax=Paenisporosarcina cavernae TaxID=2320858 RepID=A0A385YTM8_9BACL|nr:NADPH-dependent FMN reductase [Paenisporosarcina cavernae]AYC30199.1 NAD(P)H-dependent oxidoreductase [Paenisporosarcina cavernae]
MNIVVISGGPRKNGRTGIVARMMERTYGFHTLDLSVMEMPLYNGEESQAKEPVIQSLRKAVLEADGVILLSPEYHSAMSGALKNALDFLGSTQFLHKPVALLAVAGGGKGGINCLNNMRTVMRGVYANAIPKQLVLDPDRFDYDIDGLTKEAAEQVHLLVEELKMYARIGNEIKQEQLS